MNFRMLPRRALQPTMCAGQSYTESEFRHRGLARSLVKAAFHWCKANEVGVVTLQPQAGRRLYESLGFRTGNEMRVVKEQMSMLPIRGTGAHFGERDWSPAKTVPEQATKQFRTSATICEMERHCSGCIGSPG
jgi:GNAT superfamily N-acetyltransferase